MEVWKKREALPPPYIPRDEISSSRVCTYCKIEKPIEEFEKMKTGTYRYVCNACKYRYYTLPAYYRRKAKAWGLT